MRVLFCVVFLVFFLSAFETANGDDTYPSATSANPQTPPQISLSRLGRHKRSGNSGKPKDPCSHLQPPVINNSTNATKITTSPAISWKFAANLSDCKKNISLVTTCTNVKKEADVETFDNNAINKTKIVHQLLKLKKQAIYRCKGKLVTATGKVESAFSEPVVVSNKITENKDQAGKNSTTALVTDTRSSVTDGSFSETTSATSSFSSSDTISSHVDKMKLSSRLLEEECILDTPQMENYTNSSVSAEYPRISWELAPRNVTCGTDFIFSINCTNVENETDTVTIHQNITDELQLSSELVTLKDRTTYICNGKLSSSNLSVESSPSRDVTVSTFITANINIVQILPTSRSIFIEWDSLSTDPKLRYQVDIIELNAGHFVPSCGQSKNTTIQAKLQKTSYNFTSAAPDYNYSIIISTDIRHNIISSDVKYTITSAAASEEPRNVIVQDPSDDDGSSKISKVLKWKMPCQPNGRIQEFDVQLSGIYTLDPAIKHSINYTVPSEEKEDFVFPLERLRASTVYSLIISAVGKNGDTGDSFKTSLKTRDAIPSAPNVTIESLGSTYLYIKWGPSDDILYGEITNYNLTITPLAPKYGKYPSSCPVQVPFNKLLNGDTTSYNYTQALGYWNYKISVDATTSRGTGPEETILATTAISGE